MGRGDALWRGFSGLLDRLRTASDREGFLDECLDLLVEHFGAERGLIFATNASGGAVVLAARGPNRDLSPAEREEIAKSIIREAERRGESILWQSQTMGTSTSMAALDITAALVAPLRPFPGESGSPRGILYLDFRDVMKDIDADGIDFFRAAASLVSVVLEQAHSLQATREDLRVALAKAGEARDLPSLEELLFPPSMASIRQEVESAIYGESSILIVGDSGTGKTALARAIAVAAGRQPVVRAVLGASDDLNTITSELFGHERGAFSGAMAKRAGLVELAKGGTLILDEILNLPRHAQQLLLDFSQFGTYRPLGYEGAEPKKVKVRLMSATNGDLDVAVREGRFRLDLYYRLAAVVLRIPPLRARRDEIPFLAETFLRRSDPQRDWRLSVPVRRLLLSPQMAWPGNIRQLEAMLTRACERALARDPSADELRAEHFDRPDIGAVVPAAEPPATAPPPTASASGDLAGRLDKLRADRDGLDAIEREILTAALARHDGVVTRAARELNIPRTTLLSRLRVLGVG